MAEGEYYVSPTGNDNNAGTIGSPFFTLSKAWSVVPNNTGATIYLRGGTYNYNSRQLLVGKNGTAANSLKVFAFPGEVPVLSRGATYTNNQGIEFSGNYVHFKNIEITGFYQMLNQIAPSFGMYVHSALGCTFENINIHHCGGVS